ncbi:PEPxxWA-CTERM sorting domain-containing protein [Glacieibacterium sp.]|uniref:PEPxxWA-CTERM sorting domain-containing protein n=1 Tax=Glacieibacterium sp. TaxID=2860237 RepID=UPI003B0071E5
MKRLLSLAAAVAAVLSSVPASAVDLRYTIKGSNGFAASFLLDSTTVSHPLFPDNFFVFDVPGTFSDGSALAGLTFYDTEQEGGMTVFTANGTEASFVGPTLFSGTIANPTLVTFRPTVFRHYYDSSISYVTSAVAVPEPATWTMLLIGFGMVGTVVRRRGAAGTSSVAA